MKKFCLRFDKEENVKKIAAFMVFLITLTVGVCYYWNTNNVYKFVNKENITSDYRIDDISHDRIRFTEKALGDGYILKNFTISKVENGIDVITKFKTSNHVYGGNGYQKLFQDENEVVFVKTEYDKHTYVINKYLQEKDIYIEITYVSEEQVTGYEINSLMYEAESFLI